MSGAIPSATSTSAANVMAASVNSVPASRSSSWRRSGAAYSLNTGTSALEIIPPMSSSYSCVGTTAETWKASTRHVAPNRCDLTVSRARPSTRLVTLPNAMMLAARATPAVPTGWVIAAGSGEMRSSSLMADCISRIAPSSPALPPLKTGEGSNFPLLFAPFANGGGSGWGPKHNERRMPLDTHCTAPLAHWQTQPAGV